MFNLSPFLFFILGLFIGSFLGVLIDRIPRKKSVLRGRSKCDHCQKTLSWYELIPLASYIILKGKCSNCKKPISIFYPIVELSTGVLFAFTFWLSMVNGQWSIVNMLFYLFIVSVFLVVFFTDLKYGIIPDRIIFPSVFITFLYLTIYSPPLLLNHMLSAAGVAFLFFLLIVVTRGRGMGAGDLKYSFFLGFLLGFPEVIIALYIAILTGGGMASILVLWGKKKLSGVIPFGPFLTIGAFLTLFYSGELIHFIYKFLGL
ncbi:MAG: hypothetical protein A3I49_01875 [Candidatus Levybacteria bacterium RIFCSPLOWO2_02_FULL_37_11]|nr:MAG: hypothetical protein A3I49_01875 [Candidatus Levybacteria bacterium RIFCSPLOWO2_02_FULL_37_11]HBB76970.1 hypothetical protein [Candidatus Levybacteria bacterium]